MAERPTDLGEVLDPDAGPLDEADEVLSEPRRLGLVARSGFEKFFPRFLVELDSPKPGAHIREDFLGRHAPGVTALQFAQASLRLREPEVLVPWIRVGIKTRQQTLREPRSRSDRQL